MSSKGRVVVIGSGAAGSACARALASDGFQVHLAEKSRWGGTCIWWGCMPKKALYHAASTARSLRAAEQFGSSCRGQGLDWQTVLAWKWHSQETYAGDQAQILSSAGIHLLEGEARFVSADVVEVGGTRMEFDHAVIATGSRTARPPIEGIDLADDSNDALRYPAVPASLTIIGGGFIAMEFAGIYASFGASVHVIESADRVLSMMPESLSRIAERQLGELGVTFEAGSRATAISGTSGELTTEIESGDGGRHSISSERVLVATGRTPEYTSLDLDAGGVITDDHGRLVLDRFHRTSNPNVWACGDAAGGSMHTAVAAAEGRAVAASILGEPTVADCDSIPVACFTVPQLATVGQTEDQARASSISARIVSADLHNVGAAVIADERDGIVQLTVDDQDRVIGAQIAAPNASDLIQSAALAVSARLTLKQIQAAPAIHPAFSEAVYYAAWG